MPQPKITEIILYEPRPLFRNVAKNSIQVANGSLLVIEPDALIEEVTPFTDQTSLFAAGLSGAGEEIYALLRLIQHLIMLGKEIIIWVAKRDVLLTRLMYELGVQTLLCENYLEEELAQRMKSTRFRSGYLPLRPALINNMNRKNRLTHSELNILIDCARGLNDYEIASLRHMGYKTVFTHKQNIRLRLGLQKSASWLDLLNRLDQICSV
ncbi:helix-turn-helix transcriptional regulator [Enterobacter asburiae]